ncbi:MAG: hypothetical protein ABWJ42_06080 [Sulfolobales archaeon]
MSKRDLIKISKPYKLIDSKIILIPTPLADLVELDFSRLRYDLLYPRGIDSISIVKRPYISLEVLRGEWLYANSDTLYRCFDESCDIYMKSSFGTPLYVSRELIVSYNRELDEVFIHRPSEDKYVQRIRSVERVDIVNFSNLSLALIAGSRKIVVINDKIFDLRDYCLRRDQGLIVLGLDFGRKSYMLYGEESGRFNYIETFGRLTECSLGFDIGSIVIDNERTFILDRNSSYEIPGRIDALARIEDQLIGYNPATRWILVYNDNSIRYMTRVSGEEDISFIGCIEDLIVLRVGNTIRVFKGVYSKILDKTSRDELISIYRGSILIDRRDKLVLIDPESLERENFSKRSDSRCVSYNKMIYCLRRESSRRYSLYQLDLSRGEEIIIGEVIDKNYVKISDSFSDIYVDSNNNRIIRSNGDILVIPKIQGADQIMFRTDFLIGSVDVKIDILKPIKPVYIEKGIIEYSEKGLHVRCSSRPVLKLFLKVAEPEISRYYNYKIRLMRKDLVVLERELAGEELAGDNIYLEYCLDQGVLSSDTDDSYNATLLIKDLDGVSEEKIDERRIEIYKRDVNVSFDQLKDKVTIRLDNENISDYKIKIDIKCDSHRDLLEEMSGNNVIEIDLSDKVETCEEPLKIDLWLYNEGFVWGFSREIEIRDKLREEMNSETLITSLRRDLRDRILLDYKLLLLPRETLLLIKTSSDSYYVFQHKSEKRIGRLEKGVNLVKIKNLKLNESITIDLFDGVRKETLIIRPVDIERVIAEASTHARILHGLIKR